MAMNKTLHRMSNASASNREDNMFRVFSRLNTSKTVFLPGIITQVTSASHRTIVSYLKDIALAQLLETNTQRDKFLQRLQADITTKKWFQMVPASRQDVAKTKYIKLQKSLPKRFDNLQTEKKQQLQQYIVDLSEHSKLTSDEVYERLLWSIIMFELIV